MPCRSYQLLTALLLAGGPLAAQASQWDEFLPGTLAQVVATEHAAMNSQPPSGGPQLILPAQSYPRRAVVTFTGKKRGLTDESRRTIDGFARSFRRDSTFVQRFSREYQFQEGDAKWWIPVQIVLEESLRKEVPVGGRVTLLTRLMGTYRNKGDLTWVFVVNEFEAGGRLAPPSQYELNGLLLGQTIVTAERALGAPFQRNTFPDGWAQMAYGLDHAHNTYMVIKSDSGHPDLVYSLQLAGRPGSPMRPFLGLMLGDTRARVDSVLTRPSKVTRESDIAIDLLEYEGRNYTIEIDSTGVLSSIQILGYEGFATTPEGSAEPLGRFTTAFDPWNVDSLIAMVAPDIEFYRDTSLITWTRAPRTELRDTMLPVNQALHRVAEGIRGRTAESAVRLTESREVGMVYKYAEGPVVELFFVWRPGGYRLWEARFR